MSFPDSSPGQHHCSAEESAVFECHAAVDYAYPWSGLLHQFKYGELPGLAHPFARLILKQPAARKMLAESAVLIPTPLSEKNTKRRGYNQAALLADALRGQTHSIVCLERRDSDTHQHDLGRAARLNHVKNAFILPIDKHHLVQGRTVLLIDYIRTTGATLDALAAEIKRAGAARVQAIVLAQTPPTSGRAKL